MTRYDNEKIIIGDFQQLKKNEILFLNHWLKTRFICNSIHSFRQWKNWIDSSSKSDLPPDFYNPKLKLMMDVMRIDDHAHKDENGKIINPHNKREGELVKKFLSSGEGMKEIFNKGHLLLIPDSGLRGEKDHNYNFYINNFNRVIGGHIKKIDNYKQNHPGFKTIFFIMDESSPYVKHFGETRFQKVGEGLYTQPHLWWFDKNMIDCLKESKVDYIIWMAPYKHFDSEINLELPHAIIIDVEKIDYEKLINYKTSEMQSLEL